MLGTFADCEDVWGTGFEIVVDDDAAVDFEVGSSSDLGVWADAGCDYDHFSFDGRAVGESEAGDRWGANYRFGELFEVEVHALLTEQIVENVAGGGVELGFHEVIHDVNDVDSFDMVHQAPGGFETEQPTTDNGSRFHLFGVFDHSLGVFEGPERENAVAQITTCLSSAFERRDECS